MYCHVKLFLLFLVQDVRFLFCVRLRCCPRFLARHEFLLCKSKIKEREVSSACRAVSWYQIWWDLLTLLVAMLHTSERTAHETRAILVCPQPPRPDEPVQAGSVETPIYFSAKFRTKTESTCLNIWFLPEPLCTPLPALIFDTGWKRDAAAK